MPKITRTPTTPAADAATETPAMPAVKPVKARKSAPAAKTGTAPATPAADEPTYDVAGTPLTVAALTVGMMGTAKADDLYIPPAGHPRHDPRTTAARSPEFVADVVAKGIDTPVLVCVLDGRVEVKDGRGRTLLAREHRLPVPFRVVAAAADDLHARLDAMRANLARTDVDPLSRAALASEALAAGLTVAAVAAAMAAPESTVAALVRVATEGDDETKALLRDETIDASSALVVTQQPADVRAAIHAGVKALVAEAAASPTGKAKSLTGSTHGDAKRDAKTGKIKVSRNAIEGLRDAAKGKPVTQGGKDATRAVAKPAGKPAGKPTAAPETVASVRARADALTAKALALRASVKGEGDRAFLLGVADALSALFDASFVVGASHPFMETANTVLRRAKS